VRLEFTVREMAQPATNAKIEELRFRLKTDPRSRLFFPLAEELRKAGQLTEAEQVLRTGLVVHPAYLSAWVSLGRVLRDQKKDEDAVDALSRALQLDPGNVVAARILGDAYLTLGDKLEAIKKYKLVHALMPGDEELEAVIASLDHDLNPPPPPPAPDPVPDPDSDSVPPAIEEESPFDRTQPPFAESTGDAEPMHVAHEESPFEEPVAEYTAAALTLEAPAGMHITETPDFAEEPAPVVDEEADVFEPAEFEAAEDVANTLTMADLYARQGLSGDARNIYESLLARDPGNADVRAKLESLDSFAAPPSDTAGAKVERLERWLSKVSRKEVGGV